MTVVVPTLDGTGELRTVPAGGAGRRTRRSLVVVVDDGRLDAAGRWRRDAEPGPLLRHPARRGAAAARNTGLRVVETALVAFVDSDVVVPPGCPRRLRPTSPTLGRGGRRPTGHRSPAGARRLAAYEPSHSPLDLGSPGRAGGPGRPSRTCRRRRCWCAAPRWPPVRRAAADRRGRRPGVAAGRRRVDRARHVPEVKSRTAPRHGCWPFVARRRAVRPLGRPAGHPAPRRAAGRPGQPAARRRLAAARGPPAGAGRGGGHGRVGLLARAVRGSADHPVRPRPPRSAPAACPPTGEGLARAVERVWWPPLRSPRSGPGTPGAAGGRAGGSRDCWTGSARPVAGPPAPAAGRPRAGRRGEHRRDLGGLRGGRGRCGPLLPALDRPGRPARRSGGATAPLDIG